MVNDQTRRQRTMQISRFDMNKVIHIFLTLIFTVVCFGLWAALGWFQSLYDDFSFLPGATVFLLEKKLLFLVIPIPFWVFSVFATYKKQPSSENTLLYFVILTFVYLFMFAFVGLAMMLPLISV